MVMEKVVVIIPTYNEKENINLLIDVLEKVFKEIHSKWEMHILIVDDSSPDGTGKVVEEKMKKYVNVHLLTNKEKIGLGGAYMKGMNYAIQDLKADLMFEFDADFQHDPKLIPQFLEKIEQGADIVLGSRYMKGGSIPKYWGLVRKFLSVGGNLYIRTLMLDRSVHDWTTGYRAVRPWVFEKVKNKVTELKTYSFQISFLYYARKEGTKVAEVPLNFAERRWGESKMPKMSSMINTFYFVTKTRMKDFLHSRFFKFGTVGFIGYIINASFLQIFSKAGFYEWLSWLLSTELAIISNFTLNNIWTFKTERIAGLGKLVYKFFQFNLTSAGALIIQTVLGSLGVKLLGSQYRQILLPSIIVLIVLPYNYLMYNLVIWKTWKPRQKQALGK